MSSNLLKIPEIFKKHQGKIPEILKEINNFSSNVTKINVEYMIKENLNYLMSIHNVHPNPEDVVIILMNFLSKIQEYDHLFVYPIHIRIFYELPDEQVAYILSHSQMNYIDYIAEADSCGLYDEFYDKIGKYYNFRQEDFIKFYESFIDDLGADHPFIKYLKIKGVEEKIYEKDKITWVKDFGITYDKVKNITLPSTMNSRDAAKNIIKNIKDSGLLFPTGNNEKEINVDEIDVQKIIETQYGTSMSEYKNLLLTGKDSGDCLEKSSVNLCGDIKNDEINLFRYFGPLNPDPKGKYHEDSICNYYGGCRMFICDEFLLEECEEWYEGHCDVCDVKIPYRCYALRFPHINGGWSGCYCSVDCMYENILDHTDGDGYNIVVQKSLINQVWEMIKDIGIQFREN